LGGINEGFRGKKKDFPGINRDRLARRKKTYQKKKGAWKKGRGGRSVYFNPSKWKFGPISSQERYIVQRERNKGVCSQQPAARREEERNNNLLLGNRSMKKKNQVSFRKKIFAGTAFRETTGRKTKRGVGKKKGSHGDLSKKKRGRPSPMKDKMGF